MKTTSQLFDECLSNVRDDVKIELDMSFALADKIDMILREKNISQKQLAEKIGETEAEVSRWLGGTHNFTLRTIAKISDTLGVKLLTI
ncbi:helix-turn-helix transcriptional regulator [uncultured Duncaniella sp.]|uniref:helix-turn-helix domain-containing protein n=1 Tax=uncultured Duncaniella sp. TaxID=2768039 RepID=UPI001B026E0D|nr:helix-turn-helix transcriptional regulator [uncultured Duncaniella sp.]MBO4956036.1 helix-turn-helix transcriptional regulator [Muribaculaceae bacterium]